MYRQLFLRVVLFAGLLAPIVANAATPEPPPTLAGTWRGPQAPLVAQLLRGERVELPPLPADGAKPWTYQPHGESGVPAKLGAVYGGSDAQQVQGIAAIFEGLRDSFSTEAGTDGQDADVVAAMTLFVAASTAARQRNDVMADADADRLYLLLARAFAAAPELRKLTDADKQYMRDWFASVGGFIATSLRAQRGAEDRMQKLDLLVDDAVSAALGMQAKALEPLRAIALSDPGSKTADAAAMASIAGRWAASDTSSDGAWFKREYVLGGDGKYRYKSERRSGPAPANRYDTVEEGGTWTIAGTQLTLAPEWSTLTIRDGAGNITGGRASPNERVAYGWDLSLAAAAGETQLVLRTPKPTNRDGALVANAPEAVYRFARSTRVEWRW